MIHPEKLFLPPSERNSLKALHRANRDKRICDRIKAILLLDNGWSFDKVATVLLLDSDTVIPFESFIDIPVCDINLS